MEVQVDPSGEVWIWNAVAYAVSQFRVTWQIDWVEPRSTCSHCGSLKALDQRVPRLPSTAAEAGGPAFSVEDAVAGGGGRAGAGVAVEGGGGGGACVLRRGRGGGMVEGEVGSAAGGGRGRRHHAGLAQGRGGQERGHEGERRDGNADETGAGAVPYFGVRDETHGRPFQDARPAPQRSRRGPHVQLRNGPDERDRGDRASGRFPGNRDGAGARGPSCAADQAGRGDGQARRQPGGAVAEPRVTADPQGDGGTVTAFHAAGVGDRDGAGARGGPGASGGGLLVETGVEQRRVLAGRNAVHDAVGAHHRGQCGLVLPQLAAEASGTVAGSTSPATSSDPLVSRIGEPQSMSGARQPCRSGAAGWLAWCLEAGWLPHEHLSRNGRSVRSPDLV